MLAKVAELEEKTTGGILLPTSAQTRPTSGVCLWAGGCCRCPLQACALTVGGAQGSPVGKTAEGELVPVPGTPCRRCGGAGRRPGGDQAAQL